MAIQTATYQGHDVVIEEETARINYGRIRQMAYVRILDGARVIGTSGMWGGCEQSVGWVPSDMLHDRRAEKLPDDLPIPDDPSSDVPAEITDELDAEKTRAYLADYYYGGA